MVLVSGFENRHDVFPCHLSVPSMYFESNILDERVKGEGKVQGRSRGKSLGG